MKRRTLLGTAGFAALAGAQTQPADKRAIIELTTVRMRNTRDNQARRTNEFISQRVAPAMKRAGSGPVGLFSISTGEHSPSLLVLTSYPSLAAYDDFLSALSGDAEFREAAASYYSEPTLGFQRVESSLFRAFDSVPNIEVPPTEEGRAPRVFEMRIYESDNFMTLAKKVDMFNRGEVAAFRRSGMLPVFFGQAIVGPNMPNLTYMLAYDSMAHREETWRAFGQDPEWRKLRVEPGLSDAEIVSNISNIYLRPAGGSDIR